MKPRCLRKETGSHDGEEESRGTTLRPSSLAYSPDFVEDEFYEERRLLNSGLLPYAPATPPCERK